MKEQKIEIRYAEYTSQSHLPDGDKAIFEKAVEAMHSAYAPYSKYKVGAVVQIEDGTTITGNNQENIAYPSGLCAERVALYYTGAKHPGKTITAIAIAAQPGEGDAVVSPCGACRQVMAEYRRIQEVPFKVIFGSAKGNVFVIEDAISLLPLSFFDPGLTKK